MPALALTTVGPLMDIVGEIAPKGAQRKSAGQGDE